MKQKKQYPEKTGSGEYKCNLCGKAFKTEEELKEHNRTMHPEGVIYPDPKKAPMGQK